MQVSFGGTGQRLASLGTGEEPESPAGAPADTVVAAGWWLSYI